MTELSKQEECAQSTDEATATRPTTYCLCRGKLAPKPPTHYGETNKMWIGSEAQFPTGTMFGSWQVLSNEFIRRSGCIYIHCLCTSCGKDHEVNYSNLVRGITNRCGKCGQRAAASARNAKNWGRDITANDAVLRQRWHAIMDRCYNKNSQSYRLYGALGITLSETLKNYANFSNYMQSLPSCPEVITRKHTIDRIDPRKGYEEGNLRFASQKEQMLNLRSSVFIEHEGVRYNAREFCEKFCKRYRPHVVARLVKRGITAEQIIEKDMFDPHVGRRWAGKSV